MAVEAFSLTYVVYDGGVSGHKVLALITLCPIFLIVAYLTLIYSRRQIQTIIMLIGQLANEAANSVLKQHIKESRPEACAHEGYGMPSSHSQFMGFFAAYCLISSIRWENNDFISHKVLGNLSIMSLACLVMYSRVELGYHTFAQVRTDVHMQIHRLNMEKYIHNEYIRVYIFTSNSITFINKGFTHPQ
mmetsp:Transcript_16932/g.23681  ORF Transcript_16932/g.23681 Transcript_16932/m.23681 type:complete len:189 (+) Transcript_16932:31-597(+)